MISTPFPTRGNYVLPLGRRLTTPAGTFDGTVVATLRPEAYRDYFRTVDVGQDGVIWVFHADGVLLFRDPSETGHIGENVKGNPLFDAALKSSGAGMITGALEPGGGPFISGFRTIGSPHLIVAVSLSESEILADWRHQRRTTALAFMALTLTLATMLSVLFRQMAAKGRIEVELADVQRLEAERLRDANERLEEALQREQKARQESETASYLKDEFLATVSHELRTPLNAILGLDRGCSRTGSSDPSSRQRALEDDRAQRARADPAHRRPARRLAHHHRQAAARRCGRSISRAVVGAAVETVRPAARRQGHRARAACSTPASGRSCGDPDRLQQVVWNLLVERHQVHAGRRHGSTDRGCARRESHVEIVVEDTGPGIAPEFLPYVFDRFRQADARARGAHGGSGLGLAIVRHLVELHGGTVTADSAGEARGRPSRVVLPLRTARPAARSEQLPGSAGEDRGLEGGLDGTRVLVVDDESDARDLFMSMPRGCRRGGFGRGIRGRSAGVDDEREHPRAAVATSRCRARMATSCCGRFAPTRASIRASSRSR